MDKTIKAEWVKRLREPDRRQVRGTLETDEGQCCLGVLCEIAAEQGIVTRKPGKIVAKGSPYYTYGNTGGTLPIEVISWAGFAEDESTVVQIGDNTLAGLNDDKQYNFNQIADVIENNL